MERLTERTADGILVKENYEKETLKTLYSCYGEKPNSYYSNCEEGYCAMEKLADYEDEEEQGRLVKLPVKDDATGYRECVHIKSTCYHEDYKCSECPITELFCDEFYKAIDRCYEEAYASGCLAGIELGKFKAEARLKELRGGENG